MMAFRAVIDDEMTPFAAYSQLMPLFTFRCGVYAVVNYNAFKWVGQPPKIALTALAHPR